MNAKKTTGCVVAELKVVPRASENEIRREAGGLLKVRLQAPPVDGKANKALVKFLAETLNVSKSSITIVSGEKGRNKVVRISGINSLPDFAGH